MSVFKIGGRDMPVPSAITWDKSDLDSELSGRNAKGEMLRDRISSKVKLGIEWKYLSHSDVSRILQAVNPMFIEIYYPDAYTGGFRTANFYVGDRSAPIYRIKDGNEVIWEGLKMNFIEK
ncbi:MAG: hypothetical protein IJ736_03180 [Firmicutes bacterium]|nr:hypothetical protein [Bacillota bacterium]